MNTTLEQPINEQTEVSVVEVAKEHVEFTDAKIALTYACNSMVVAKTLANMDIYRPKVVILDLPK